MLQRMNISAKISLCISVQACLRESESVSVSNANILCVLTNTSCSRHKGAPLPSPLMLSSPLPHQQGQLLLHLQGRLGELLAPEECRPASAAATLGWGFIRTGLAALASGLKLAGERGGESSVRGGPLLRYYMTSIENIAVPLKG